MIEKLNETRDALREQFAKLNPEQLSTIREVAQLTNPGEDDLKRLAKVFKTRSQFTGFLQAAKNYFEYRDARLHKFYRAVQAALKPSEK